MTSYSTTPLCIRSDTWGGDRQRISIVGGSAGGYTALMLSALQMGNCATIATAPISNVYFNFYQYFPMAERDDAPFFLKLVTGMFLPIQENFPDKNDMSRWEALSAVGLADCFSNPLIVVNVTSDILVPIDQTTREFTYDHEGVDDTVYGSLAVYRQEVVEELGQWAENHSLFKLDTAMREAIANAEESGGYLAAWEEIKSVLE